MNILSVSEILFFFFTHVFFYFSLLPFLRENPPHKTDAACAINPFLKKCYNKKSPETRIC